MSAPSLEDILEDRENYIKLLEKQIKVLNPCPAKYGPVPPIQNSRRGRKIVSGRKTVT